MKFAIRFLLGVLGILPAVLFGAEADYEEIFEARIRSVVAVEYFVETEIDRRPAGELGIVADDRGLIAMQDFAIPGWIPPKQLKEFKVFPLRSRDEFSAVYLGQDTLTGWHFLRVEDPAFPARTTPVTAYETARPKLGQEVWGFAAMDKDFDFEPYFIVSQFSLMRDLPRDMGFTVSEVASPGSLIFAEDGKWIGWATSSFLREGLLHVGEERIPAAFQGTRESGAFFPADEVLPYLNRVPADPEERTVPWVGVLGMQSVERELANFMNLEGSGVVLSEIVEGSPGAEADLQRGDVVVAIDGEPIPVFRPHSSSPEYVQLQVLKKAPGDKISFTIRRGTEELEREVTIGVQPPTVREARREYFSKIGFTAREFLLFDGMARRVGPEPERGLIVQFVRPNSPGGTSGLRVGDWIQEVDGTPISGYAEAIELLRKADESEGRRETVLLINRQNETSVIRIRMQ